MVLDESGFGMKVVLDENFWDEKRKVHPNLDETVPNPPPTVRFRDGGGRECSPFRAQGLSLTLLWHPRSCHMRSRVLTVPCPILQTFLEV